jgi:hypothetical protein
MHTGEMTPLISECTCQFRSEQELAIAALMAIAGRFFSCTQLFVKEFSQG